MSKRIIMNVPYFQVPNEIFEMGLSSYQLSAYIYLCRCGNHGGTAFPSYNTIARKSGMSKRKAMGVVKELEGMGLLVKTVRPKGNKDNHTNIYEVVTPGAQGAPGSAEGAPNKELQDKEINNDKGQNLRPDYPLKEYAKDIVREYVYTYKEILGKDHPRLRREQLERVIDVIVDFERDAFWQPVDWSAMIERHFERCMDTDYNINHFATPGVLENIRYEIGFKV